MDEQTSPTHSPKARILVVDDHPSTAILLSRAISQLGPDIEVMSATSGTSALEQVKGGAVDLLVTDMMMPDMNGLELIEALNENPGGRPTFTILITAFDIPGLRVSARRLKVNEILIKPFRPERLCQIISKALDEMSGVKLPRETGSRESFKILIADDSQDNVALLSRFLETEGYTLINAPNGVVALEKTRAEMPDLILLDVNMPEKDGFQVLQEIRADPAIQHVPVIILTAARPDPLDVQSGLNLGADDYMTKPFDRRELLARIRTKLRAKETEEAIRRRNKEMAVLPEIGKELSSHLDLNELAGIILRRTVETLGAARGHIFVLGQREPFHREYRMAAADPSTDEIQLPPLNRMLEQIHEASQGIIFNDVQSDTRWNAKPGGPNGSAIVVPIWGRLGPIGLLVLIHEQAGFFQPDHQMLLQAMASQAAIAIGNAQLHAANGWPHEQLVEVAQNSADAMLTFDGEGQLLALNPPAEKLFANGNARLGEPLTRGRGYESLILLLEQVLASRKSDTAEIGWPDRRVFAAQVIPMEDGGCVACLHDVSRFRALQRDRNDLIAAASHDLKDPITIISILCELIDRAGPLNEKQMEYMDRVAAAAQNMNELAQNLLGLAEAELDLELKQEPIDVNALVAQIVDEFQPQTETREQSLQLKKARGRPEVHGNPLQLRQALRNLVGNAIKYTPPQGSIKVSIESRERMLVINVKDTGYGISQADLPFVFERFYRAQHHPGGGLSSSGLGLAIVKSVAERHGGKVSVTSDPEKGSCFTMTLPLA
jgi:signal transduction histidine kinase/DNA-binding response OmpR family regulator